MSKTYRVTVDDVASQLYTDADTAHAVARRAQLEGARVRWTEYHCGQMVIDVEFDGATGGVLDVTMS